MIHYRLSFQGEDYQFSLEFITPARPDEIAPRAVALGGFCR
jgi:hypothetical protein